MRYNARVSETRERLRLWAEKYPDREKASRLTRKRRYRARHRQRLTEEARQLRQANLEAQRAKERAKYAADPGRYRAHGAAKRAARLQAAPPWVDHVALRAVYAMADFLGLTVDHIEPLRGKNACGLHVPWNLQLLGAVENSRKGNKRDYSPAGIVVATV